MWALKFRKKTVTNNVASVSSGSEDPILWELRGKRVRIHESRTQKHYGKYEKAGSQAHVEHSENDSGQNAASADRCEEQQQPSERRDRNATAQAAPAVENTTPTVFGSGVTQTPAASPNRRRGCPWRPVNTTKRGLCNVQSRQGPALK